MLIKTGEKLLHNQEKLLAILKAVEHFHHYLYGRKFLLQTDHASLTWLLNFRNPEGQIAWGIQWLQECDFGIRHQKGAIHGNAHSLSSMPCNESCWYCSRVEKKYENRISMMTERMKTRYVIKAMSHEFQLDGKVLLWNPVQCKGLSSKLQPNWDGPYTVFKGLNDVVVCIRKSPSSKPKIVHYNRLAL